MKKSEIAESLGLSLDTVKRWADWFSDWLDIDSRNIDKIHDEKDYEIFRIIKEIDTGIPNSSTFSKRKDAIERELRLSLVSKSIHQDRKKQKEKPEIKRWNLVSTAGFSLSQSYEWLSSLRSYVDNIADFGCWAIEGCICEEPFALLWTLDAAQIVVIEKESEDVRNATEWLKKTRLEHDFFAEYQVYFVEGDMRDDTVSAQYFEKFDLAFCQNVLYFMQGDVDEVKKAINTMKQVVKPDGWLIAIEEKFGVRYKEIREAVGKVMMPRQVPENEPTDISYLFESKEWERINLENSSDWSYCYHKKAKIG